MNLTNDAPFLRCPCSLCKSQVHGQVFALAVALVSQGHTVTSGYRCPSHNLQVGGVRKSAHLAGLGLDVVPGPGTTSAALALLIEAVNEGYRCLVEDDHVHVEWTSPLTASWVVS